MASTARAPAAHAVLPDEIWEEIFLHLDAAADRARASAACSSFHRIVSARRFLRRFGSLHSPPVLGFISCAGYGYQGFLPVSPPHRSAPEASALVQAADFTFSFLPDPRAWRSCDARDGRVLLSRSISASTAFDDFVVCDPLHRRYVKIPRMPDDLATSTMYARYLLPVLAPADENDEHGFRIICTLQYIDKGKVMAVVFSSCNQTWQGIIGTLHLPNGFLGCKLFYAHGCLYRMIYGNEQYLLMLDTSEMKFSIIDLPPHNFYTMHAIVEAGEGRLGLLAIADGRIDLYCKNWQSNGVGAQEWQHDKLIPLSKDSGINYRWEILGIAGRYLALLARQIICDELSPNSEHFVLDIKTLLVEKLTSNIGTFYGLPYARFPPPLALPRM